VLQAIGFTWSDEGSALYESAYPGISSGFPGFSKDTDAVLHRCLLFLAPPQSAALDAEVSAWIPSPAAIAQHELDHTVTHMFLLGVLGLAASAFLRLGRDGDAAEAARILVSPEHGCFLPGDLAHGHGRRTRAGGGEARRCRVGGRPFRQGAASRGGEPVSAVGGDRGAGLEAGGACEWGCG
jgi:hypothetical protein